MIRRPPRSTRTDTLFPYTTLFRAVPGDLHCAQNRQIDMPAADHRETIGGAEKAGRRKSSNRLLSGVDQIRIYLIVIGEGPDAERSEERRVGKECVSTCRSRWSP